MGETVFADEFISPDTHKAEGSINFSPDPRQSWDSVIDWLNNDAMGKDLSIVAEQSHLYQKYDLKNNKDWADNGIMTGRMLNGKYATARSAGNYLAGLNGVTGRFQSARISGETYMKIAGALQTDNFSKANVSRIITFGTSFGPAPYYGEEPYSGRMIQKGIEAGIKRIKPW